MPVTALHKILFTAEKASTNVVPFPNTFNNFSLGMMIKESTCLDNSLTPKSANAIRFLPSKENGFVTTATVKIPNSFAI